MIELTRTQTLELLERAVEEQGADHTAHCEYMVGQYVDDSDEVVFTGPQCIVGFVVHYLDESDSTLEMLNSDYQGCRVVAVNFDELGVKTELGVVELLDAAQLAQDEGLVWGEALEAAKEKFAEQEQRIVNLRTRTLPQLNH